MCGIAGFYDPDRNFEEQPDYHRELLEQMRKVQSRRGPDDNGVLLKDCWGLAHTRLSVIDLTGGRQPMTRWAGGRLYGITYNGELYNTMELKEELSKKGWTFATTSDTEVILTAFIQYGPDFVTRLNGIFAFAIMDPSSRSLFLYRDRAGVKPLFYARIPQVPWKPGSRRDDSFSTPDLGSAPGGMDRGGVAFASEIKGILSLPDFEARVDMNGLREIFGIGPAKTYGCGVFQGVAEVLPGHYLQCSPQGWKLTRYWELVSRPHTDSYQRTVETTSWLVLDSIRRQMVSDVPICTFLSGGVDSSLVSAVCAGELKKRNRQLTTYSFDFTGNQENFKANAFQPSLDRPYVERMVRFLDSDHRYLECDNISQADCLYDSVNARDLPAMADVDSSLLYFCSLVSKGHKVALTGECADEIFGGYPWFHSQECFKARTFPWTMDLNARKSLLADEFLDLLDMDRYVSSVYQASVAETPRLLSDTPEEARRREISYLNLKWFMQTLLDRMDRTSMYAGLEARVPFADHRIIEYVWNVPWDMKTKNGVVKSLLREAAKDYLPREILQRRKSPYPKTYDRAYESLLARRISVILSDSQAPVMKFLDKKKAERFMSSPSDYGKPWYGQLMAGPQMLAYIIQIKSWLEKYKIRTP